MRDQKREGFRGIQETEAEEYVVCLWLGVVTHFEGV